MPIISAAEEILTSLVVLAKIEAKYRRRENGKYESPSDFLPQPNNLFMRPVAGFDTNMFI